MPLIGRVHDIPVESSWLKFYEWSKKYGPIYQTEMFGTVHVWISTERIALDLLSRRASNYSDRPQIPNLPDNRTSGHYLALSGRNGEQAQNDEELFLTDIQFRYLETSAEALSAAHERISQCLPIFLSEERA